MEEKRVNRVVGVHLGLGGGYEGWMEGEFEMPMRRPGCWRARRRGGGGCWSGWLGRGCRRCIYVRGWAEGRLVQFLGAREGEHNKEVESEAIVREFAMLALQTRFHHRKDD